MAMDLIGGAGPPALQGGGPGPGAPSPADLAAVLGIPAGGPPPGPSPGVDNPAGGSELDALDAISAAIDSYMQIPTVEESERLIAEKMSTMVQQLKASNEKMADQISGGNPAMRKALGPQQ